MFVHVCMASPQQNFELVDGSQNEEHAHVDYTDLLAASSERKSDHESRTGHEESTTQSSDNQDANQDTHVMSYVFVPYPVHYPVYKYLYLDHGDANHASNYRIGGVQRSNEQNDMLQASSNLHAVYQRPQRRHDYATGYTYGAVNNYWPRMMRLARRYLQYYMTLDNFANFYRAPSYRRYDTNFARSFFAPFSPLTYKPYTSYLCDWFNRHYNQY